MKYFRTRDEIQAAQEPDREQARLRHYVEELQNSLPPMTPTPNTPPKSMCWSRDDLTHTCSNTPSEVDELEAKILEDLKHTLKLMPSNNRETFAFEVARYITKQQALYHAAGLRELEHLSWSNDHLDPVVNLSDIRAAIAREESK